MIKSNLKTDLKYFGTFSREAMRVLKFMIAKWPKKKLFASDELGQVISAKDRGLGGVLGTFSKRSGQPLIIKAGTITTGWQGQKFNRPRQVWVLNPQLKAAEIKKIKEALDQILLE